MSELQAEIDAIAYPPSHTYRLETLTPTGQLAARWPLVAQWLASGKRLLDVGANKGFFTLMFAELGLDVMAIEPDPRCFRLLTRLRETTGGFDVRDDSFGSFYAPHRYDRVWVGSGHHHLFDETNGFCFCNKLAAITGDNGIVLVEGLVSNDHPDARRMGLAERGYNEPEFIDRMKRAGFSLTHQFDSPLDGRGFYVFHRVPRTYWDVADMPEDERLSSAEDNEYKYARTVFRSGCFVCKIGAAQCFQRGFNVGFTDGWEQRAQIMLEVAGGPGGWMTTPFAYLKNMDGKFCGHAERFVPMSQVEDAAILQAHRLNNDAYLGPLGYVNRDPARANATMVNGEVVFVDKGAVRHFQNDDIAWFEGEVLRRDFHVDEDGLPIDG